MSWDDDPQMSSLLARSHGHLAQALLQRSSCSPRQASDLAGELAGATGNGQQHSHGIYKNGDMHWDNHFKSWDRWDNVGSEGIATNLY